MKAHHIIVACALLLTSIPASAGVIVGLEFLSPLVGGGPAPTRFVTVDPLTGSTTPFGGVFNSGYIVVSSSLVDGTLFTMSPVNLYRINPFTGETIGYLCPSMQFCTFAANDHAYDPSNQNTYALSTLGNDEVLVQMVDRGLLSPVGSAPPGSHQISYELVGLLHATNISLIEYIPGLGLYGIDGGGAGYLIDETTGRASPLAPLTGLSMPITGLAYSFDTNRLIASAADRNATGFGMIYQLDPLTGHATLLNDRAANLTGIAFIDIPEALPNWMLAGGLALWFILLKRRCTVR